MAGTDQSVNLGGMLNQIAGTIGSGYQINGQNAGAALGGVIANSVRPEIDQNNPESLERYAQWARNNGRDEEALRYSERAGAVKKEQSAAKALGNAQDFQTKAVGLAQYGDVNALKALRKDIGLKVQQAGQSGNLEEAKILSQQAQQIDTMMPQAQEVATDKKASGIMQMMDILDSGKMPDGRELPAQQRSVLQQAVNTHMNDHRVVDKTNQMVLQKAQMDDVNREKKVRAADEKFMAEVGTTVESIDEALEAIPEDVRGEFLSRAEAMKDSIVRKENREVEAAANNTQLLSEEYVATIQTTIDGMPEGELKKLAQRQLDGAKKRDDALFVNGTYTDLSRKGAEAAWNRDLNVITQYAGQAAASADSSARQEKAALQNQLLEADLLRFSPIDPAEVRRSVQARYPDEDVTKSMLDAMESEIRARREASYRELQERIDPEAAAQYGALGEDLIPPGLTEEQRLVFKQLIEKPKNRKIVEEGGRAAADQLIAAAVARNIWPTEEFDDTTPIQEMKEAMGFGAEFQSGVRDARDAASMQQTGASLQSLASIWKAVYNGEE